MKRGRTLRVEGDKGMEIGERDKEEKRGGGGKGGGGRWR